MAKRTERSERTVRSPSTGRLDHEVGKLLVAVMDSVHDHAFKAIGELEVSPTMAYALRCLDEPCRMRELAERMGFDASHITGIVDRLEARGFVERQADPKDRRVKRVVVTKAGQQVQDQIETKIFSSLPLVSRLTVAQRRELRDLLALALAPGDTET